MGRDISASRNEVQEEREKESRLRKRACICCWVYALGTPRDTTSTVYMVAVNSLIMDMAMMR